MIGSAIDSPFGMSKRDYHTEDNPLMFFSISYWLLRNEIG